MRRAPGEHRVGGRKRPGEGHAQPPHRSGTRSGTGCDWYLAQAEQILADSPYGHGVHVGQTLAEAEHALAATVLWHLRVLAGWQPRPGARA